MDEAEKESKKIIEVPSLMLIWFKPEILERGEQDGDRDEEFDQIWRDIDDMQRGQGQRNTMADSKGGDEDEDLFPIGN